MIAKNDEKWKKKFEMKNMYATVVHNKINIYFTLLNDCLV